MPKKIRCVTCKKSLGYNGHKCKCDNMYCDKHRMPEKHDCSFDHKIENKTRLIKENPVIVPDKLIKI